MVRPAPGFVLAAARAANIAWADGGPLGIDHRLSYDDSGIWKHSDQKALVSLLVVGEINGSAATIRPIADSGITRITLTEGLHFDVL